MVIDSALDVWPAGQATRAWPAGGCQQEPRAAHAATVSLAG
jgi:hypothetical protein